MDFKSERQRGNTRGAIWAGPLDRGWVVGAHPQGVMLLPWETGIAFPISTPSQTGGNESQKVSGSLQECPMILTG